MRRAIGEAHRRYTRAVNFREGWRGHLWQGRFSSHAMEERYLLTAVRFIELNPVRAALVQKPEEYRWSSAAAHLAGRDDFLVRVAPLHRLVANWESFLSEAPDEGEVRLLKNMSVRAGLWGIRVLSVGLRRVWVAPSAPSPLVRRRRNEQEGTGISEISMVSPEYLPEPWNFCEWGTPFIFAVSLKRHL